MHPVRAGLVDRPTGNPNPDDEDNPDTEDEGEGQRRRQPGQPHEEHGDEEENNEKDAGT